MTKCPLCMKEIPKIKGRRISAEPKFHICDGCQKKKQQIIAKYGVDSNTILNATIRSLVDCNSEAFKSTGEQVRLKHKIWAANAELEDEFPGLKERSGQSKLHEFDQPTETPGI